MVLGGLLRASALVAAGFVLSRVIDVALRALNAGDKRSRKQPLKRIDDSGSAPSPQSLSVAQRRDGSAESLSTAPGDRGFSSADGGDEADWALGDDADASGSVPRTHCALRATPLSLSAVANRVRSPAAGAVVTFSGTTRNTFENRVVTELEYEAYASMALKEMRALCDAVRQQWPEVLHLAIEHKTGPCPVMHTSVIIAVSSPHRAPALAAATFAIDALKARVPIWKKEKYAPDTNSGADVDAQWKQNAEFAPMPRQST